MEKLGYTHDRSAKWEPTLLVFDYRYIRMKKKSHCSYTQQRQQKTIYMCNLIKRENHSKRATSKGLRTRVNECFWWNWWKTLIVRVWWSNNTPEAESLNRSFWLGPYCNLSTLKWLFNATLSGVITNVRHSTWTPLKR